MVLHHQSIKFIPSLTKEIARKAFPKGNIYMTLRDELGTFYDTEAHYGKKRHTTWIGYKVHLTETCEKKQVHLITNVQTTRNKNMVKTVQSTCWN